MKTKRYLLATILKGAGFFLFLIILATCDVGLGPSVDTNAPTVTITSPAASEVVSGQLEFRGDAKDDGTIKSVEIKFEGLGSAKGTDYTFYSNPEDTNARKVLVANKEWKLALDSTGNNLIEDGTYQLIVKVTDESGKCSESRTTFTVDNTAPVVLVTSPDEKSSTQNYDLQFEGKIYDLTEIDDIIITVFDEAGNEQVSKSASLSGTSEWKVTFNRDEPSSDLIIPATNNKISNGDYLYAVKASDKAGNASTYFFHKEDVYNCYNKNKLSIDKWAAFDKGTINWAELTQDSNDTTFSSVDNERTWLEGIRLPITPSSSGAGFNYSETQVMQITWTNIQSDTMLNTGDKIVGSITPPTGVDAPFRNDTFKCYISKSPFEIDPDSKTILSTPTVVASIETDSVNSISPTYKLTNIGQSRSFSISTDALGGGTYYIYIEISNSSGSRYGATQCFSIDLSSPILTTNLTGQQVIKTSYDFKVEGTALISTGAIGCTLQYVVSVDGGEEQGPYYIHSVETDGDWDGNWELDLPNSDGTYSYTFTAVSGEYKTSKNYIIQLDTTEPEVEISSISQSNDAGDYIIATGTATDNLSQLDKLEYSFAPKNTAVEDLVWTQENTKSLNSWNLKIPAASKDEGDYVLRVRLTDKAGWTAWRKPQRDESDNLITNAAGDVQYDNAELGITLDKHYPILSVVINGTTTSTSEAERTKTPSEGWNFDSINPITGNVSDTHLEQLSVQFGDNTAVTITPESDGTWEWTPPSNTNDGTYSVTIIAEDKVGKTAKINTTYTKDQFGPELEVSTIESDGIYTKGNNEENSLLVKGTATDSPAGLKTISYLLNEDNSDAENPDKSNPSKYAALSNKESKQNWEIKFPSTPTAAELAADSGKQAKPSLPEGVNTLRIKAVDKSGNETYYPLLDEEPIKFKTDYVRPTAYFGYTADNPETTAVESWNIQNTNRENTKNNIELTGMASDGSNTDGATIALSYSYVNASGVTVDTNVPNANISWDKTTGQWNWTFPVTNTTVNGTYTFKISVTDIAGRTTSADHVVCVDTTPPIIDTGLSDFTDDISFKSDSNWIAVRCRDEHTSLKSISWYLGVWDDNDDEYKYGAKNEVSLSASTTEITLPEGTNQAIKFVVEDIVGNVNEEEYTGITVDFNPPELKGGFASSAPKYLKNGSDPFKIITATGDTLIAEDTIAVDSFTVTATKDETPQKNSGFGEFWYKKENLSGNQILASQLTDIPPFEGSETTGGNWVVTATVTDKSGWTASKTYKFTIDTVAPTITGITEIAEPKNRSSISYQFGGTADDGESGSGVKKIEVAFTSGNDEIDSNTIIETASGQNEWTFTSVFSKYSVFNEEGEKTIYVRATDAAETTDEEGNKLGNVGEWESATFVYDKNDPTTSIYSYKKDGDSEFTKVSSNAFQSGKVFTLRGKAYDSYNGIASVKVFQKIGEGESVNIGEINTFETPAESELSVGDPASTQMWEISGLPKNAAGSETMLADGKYKYYVIATDKVGKETYSEEITVTVDTTAPTVKITAPDNSAEPANDKKGDDSLSGNSYTFRGEASDGDDGVGLAKLYYAFVKDSNDNFEATAPTTINWDEQNINGDWTISRSFKSGNEASAANELTEGHWFLFVKSVDKAGNESNPINIHFFVDMGSPALTVTTDGIKNKENGTYYFNVSDTAYTHDTDPDSNSGLYTLSGTAKDSYGISNVTVQVGEASAVSITPASNVDTWTYNVAVTDDTETPVTITAKDLAGKTVTKKYTLYRDTTAPDVTIISPAEGESFLNNTINLLKGSVSDAGSGVKPSINYEITKQGENTATKNGMITRKGESWTLENVDFRRKNETTDEYITQEGTFSLKITAEDVLGNNKEETVEFYVDTANPTLNETGVGTGGKTTNNTFSLSGWVYDSNALYEGDNGAAVTINSDKWASSKKIELSTDKMTEVTGNNSTTPIGAEHTGWYYWTQSFYVGDVTAGTNGVPTDAEILGDDTYVFTITAKDVAGKTAVVQRTITVDTRAPVFTVDEQGATLDYSGNNADKIKTIDTGDEEQLWFTDSVVTIKVAVTDQKVSDDAGAEEGSGLSTVKYETLDGKSGYLMKSSENGSNDWSTSISFSEGTGNGIRIIAEDAAGNKKIYPEEAPVGMAQYETIRIDTKVPNISLNELSDLLTNGGETNQFTISGTASDVTGGTGMDSVSAKIGDTEYTMDEDSTAENWKITFNTPNADESATTNRITSDGTYVVTITAKDKAGLEKTVEKNVTVDTAEAHFVSSSFSSEAAADCGSTGSETWYGSTSLDITGSFTDANSIDSVQWSWDSPEATNADGSPKATWRSFDRSMTGDNSTGYTCTFSGTVPVSTTLKNGTLYVKATDKAGNVTNTTLTGINVDLGYPTLSITSPVGTPLVNGDSDLIVKVKAEDTFLNGATTEVASGVKSVKLKIGSQDFTTPDDSTEIATAGEPDIYTLTISGEMITDLGDSVIQSSVYIQAEDYTGKTQITSFALQIDKNPPTAVITSPYTASILNKEIQFTGRANDDQNLLIVNLYYTTAKVHPGVPNADPDTGNVWIKTAESTLDAEAEAAKTKWVLFETFEGSNGYNWDETIDTTQSRYVNENEDGKSYIHFMAEAFDAARNSGDVSRAISSCTIDQLSDCPVITFSNIKADDHGLLKSTQTIYGTIEDDDGSVNELRVSSKKNANWNDSDSTVCIVRNGSWSYTDTGMTDGDKILYFRVKDAKNSIFVTPDENATEEELIRGIYISGTEDNPVQQMKPLKFRIDMNPPQINQQGFRIYQHKAGDAQKAYNDDVALQDDDENKKVRNFDNNMILGGTNNLFDFYASAYDANGIKAMSVKIGTQTVNGVNTGVKDAVGNDVWLMSDINVSKEMLADDAQNLTVTAIDMTDSDSSVILKVRIDNTAPTFSVTSHQNESERNVTGIVTLRGTASDAIAGVASVKYMIPTKNSVDNISVDTDSETNKWHKMTLVGTTTWKIEFKNYIDSDDPDLSTKELKEYATSDYAEETYTDSGVWKIPVFFRLEDTKGNSTVDNSFMFFVNPDGDKPTATVTYPTNGATLGGTIRIFGSATDNEAVSAVYMQIDADSDGDFDETDSTYLSSHGYTVETINNSDWGIKTSGRESWNQTINTIGEFDPENPDSNENGTKKINIRVCAKDENGLFGVWSSPAVQIEIDKNAPRIGSSSSLKLVQYENNENGTGKVTAMQDYQDGISVKGNWYLTGSAEDESGIKSITVTPSQGSLKIKSGSSWTDFTSTSATKDENDNNVPPDPTEFRIPVNTSGSGALSFEIRVVENTDQNLSTSQTISIKYDNSAPNIGTNLKHNVSNIIGDGSDNTIVIEQSNNAYSIEGTVEDGDGGSGFSRIAIYFKRVGSGSDSATRIYNPALTKGSSGNRTDIDGNIVKLVNGLPIFTVENVTRNTEDTLTVPESLNPNIRKGGLVRIGGVYRLITGVSSSTVTFTPAVSKDYTTAEFVYALIIDNFKVESPEYDEITGALNKISNDDGDGVIESIEKNAGNLYDWSISIDSKQIPDGPIDICCVAFDNADNASDVKTVSTSVFNNRPAIANIWLGTDYDRNNSVSANEFVKIRNVVLDSTDILNYDSNWKKSASTVNVLNVSNQFKAIGKTVIKPEIIGGNGTLNYYYAKDTDSLSTYTPLRTSDTANVSNSIVGDTTTSVITLGLSGTGSSTTLDGLGNGIHTFYFKLYDSTENCIGNSDFVSSNNSQWASFAVKFDVQVVDEIPPEVTIKPFYWNSSSDNSLYKNSVANGHIELTKDLENYKVGDVNMFGASSGLMDTDPKVSGKIRITGTAKDETCLQSIWIKMDEFTFTGLTPNDYDDDGYARLSSFSGGSWSSCGTEIKDNNGKVVGVELQNGYGFFVTDDKGVRADGHEVSWELDIDTSIITDGADTDLSVKVKVFDTGSNFNNKKAQKDASGNYVKNASGKVVLDNVDIPSYRMDVVPYITKVTTALSSLKKNNPSVYNRTAKGHYSVASTENIKIEGFNLYRANPADANNPLYCGTVQFTKEKSSSTNYTVSYDEDGVDIPSEVKSGEVSIIVNGVESLNNKNNNNGKGDYSGVVDLSTSPTGDKSVYDNYYNRQPNGENNNLFTDDVILDVWQINSNVAQAQGSAYIAEAIMKINPVSGMLNFAYNSGPANFSMANGTTTSHTTWVGNLARMTSAGFAVDENGVTHGITVGLDTNPSSGSAGRMQYVTSKWGPVYSTRDQAKGTQENYGGVNSSRFETIGAPKGTYNGTTYDDFLFMEDRFASPSLATAIHKDDSNKEHTYVFLAYYDDLNNEIRFRYGDLDATTEHTVGRSFGCFQDAKLFGYGGTEDRDHKSFDTNKYPQYFSVIASPSTTAKSGNYLSIDIIKGSSVDEDVIVATWQDSAAGNWYYAYKKKPCTDNDVGAVPAEGASTDGYWSPPLLIASKAGEDCHISVDPRGGVHIAAYDSSEANLLYAYFANYSDSTPQLVTVDSYGFTGEHLTLDTAISADGHYVVPFIGYYMSSARKPAIARLDKVISASSGIGTIPEGVDSKDYNTGKWEISIVPTDSTYSDNYAYSHVNVGVWKNSSGWIINSTRPAEGTTNVDTWVGNNKAVGDETNGYFWGNGTDNPVLGYAIRVGTRGYIETAQKK